MQIQIQRHFSIATFMAALALGGCATSVSFTSEPTGAAVSYRGQVIGTTPFDFSVHDQFGWFSTYTFTANLDGYQPATQEFKERTPADAQWILPPKVNFTLQK